MSYQFFLKIKKDPLRSCDDSRRGQFSILRLSFRNLSSPRSIQHDPIRGPALYSGTCKNVQVPSRTSGLTRRTRFESVSPKNDPSAGLRRYARACRQTESVGGRGTVEAPGWRLFVADEHVAPGEIGAIFRTRPALRFRFYFRLAKLSIPDKTPRAKMYFCGERACILPADTEKCIKHGIANEHVSLNETPAFGGPATVSFCVFVMLMDCFFIRSATGNRGLVFLRPE